MKTISEKHAWNRIGFAATVAGSLALGVPGAAVATQGWDFLDSVPEHGQVYSGGEGAIFRYGAYNPQFV